MVKTLVEMATSVCLKNLKDIDNVGTSMPYRILYPILVKITDARQLRTLEKNSPYLRDEDGELWKRLIDRNFKMLHERHNLEATKPKHWRKIYKKYEAIDTKSKEEARARLMQQMGSIREEKESNISKVINFDSRILPPPPRDVKSEISRRHRTSGPGGPDLSELRFTGGSKTKTNTGKGVIQKARREAREISSRNRMNTNTSTSSVPSVRRPLGPLVRAPGLSGIRPPKPKPPVSLRSAPKPEPPKEPTYYVSEGESDESEDSEPEYSNAAVGLENNGRGDDLDDLFGLPAEPSSSTTVSKSQVEHQPQARAGPSAADRQQAMRHMSPPYGTSSPSNSGLPPRKRKVDIFMRPKPKKPRH